MTALKEVAHQENKTVGQFSILDRGGGGGEDHSPRGCSMIGYLNKCSGHRRRSEHQVECETDQVLEWWPGRAIECALDDSAATATAILSWLETKRRVRASV